MKNMTILQLMCYTIKATILNNRRIKIVSIYMIFL